MTGLLTTLQALELELHHPGVRCSRERLEQLLHPDFHEVGRSGRVYARDTIVQYLTTLEIRPGVVSSQFRVEELAPGVALLNFRSVQADGAGRWGLHTLRSSVWLHTARGWQLRYHQGTPAAEPW